MPSRDAKHSADFAFGSKKGQYYRRLDERSRERWRQRSRRYYWENRERVIAYVKKWYRARKDYQKTLVTRMRHRTVWRRAAIMFHGRRINVYVYTPAETRRDMGLTYWQWYYWIRDGIMPGPVIYTSARTLSYLTEDQHDLLVDSIWVYRYCAADCDPNDGARLFAAKRAFSEFVWARWKTIPDGIGSAWKRLVWVPDPERGRNGEGKIVEVTPAEQRADPSGGYAARPDRRDERAVAGFDDSSS